MRNPPVRKPPRSENLPPVGQRDDAAIGDVDLLETVENPPLHGMQGRDGLGHGLLQDALHKFARLRREALAQPLRRYFQVVAEPRARKPFRRRRLVLHPSEHQRLDEVGPAKLMRMGQKKESATLLTVTPA